MIAFDKVCVRFGGFELFSNISFLIKPKSHIGLIGRNGAGKTTLFKTIMGLQEIDEGKINIPSDVTLGYLPQQMIVNDTQTVIEEVKLAFDELNSIQKTINSLNEEINQRTDYESNEYSKLIEKMTLANEQYQMHGGHSREGDIEKTILGLGFEPKDFNRYTKEFSGGWRMRIELAKILLKKPDVMLLDEPTNHLDIESIQWLEDFLKNYSGSIILISHDRAFLDSITTRTIEISLGKIYDYNLPYSKFIEQKNEIRQQQMSSFKNQQKMISETEDFIKRFRYKATKAVQVQSRIKQLDKLDRIEIDDEDLSKINIRFPSAPRAGAIVVETQALSKKYGDHLVLDQIDLIIERGEKVAFVGKNGEGKTTLSRIIVGDLDYTGNIRLGHNVHIGYFAQNQDNIINDKKTVFETLDEVAVGNIRTKVRDILGAFLFSKDDIDKKVKVLSGGEKSRLALAKLLLEPYNLLVFDEPTNHLDIKSKDLLKQALQNYNGTLIIVSHDREFLDGLTDKIYEFKNKNIKEYLCGIYQFLKTKQLNSLKELEKTDKKLFISNENNNSSQNKQIYFQKKELEKEIRKNTNQINKSEKIIEQLELTIDELKLSISIKDHEELIKNDVFSNFDNLQNELIIEMEKWEDLHDKLEKLKDQRN